MVAESGRQVVVDAELVGDVDVESFFQVLREVERVAG